MTRTSPWAILAIIICTIFTSLGQILWKLGVDYLDLSLLGLISNWHLWLGFVFYGIGAAIMIIALSKGELSVLYPFIALSFIWVALLSSQLLNEAVNPVNWLGISSIILGVTMIGVGGSK
ncbi:EamA/RhaT family transporter [Nanoarchaeota archaeon]